MNITGVIKAWNMKMDSEKPFTKVNDCTACLMHRFLHKSCSRNAINFTNWPRKAPEMNPGLRGRGCAPAGFVEMLCFTSKRGIPFTVCGKNEWFWSVPSWCELSERGAQNCVCGSCLAEVSGPVVHVGAIARRVSGVIREPCLPLGFGVWLLWVVAFSSVRIPEHWSAALSFTSLCAFQSHQ